MKHEKLCPRCGAPMHYDEEDYEIGMEAGWLCEACGYTDRDEFEDEPA